MIWLKFAHVAAICVWTAALLVLPGLYVRRADTADGDALHRLQALVRFVYVAVASPAAFLAVATGTGLVFVRETYAAWFGLKLLLVGLMVVIHILTGLVILRLFDKDRIYPPWRFLAVTGLTIVVATAILAVVLAKPTLPAFPPAFAEPGSLPGLVSALNPFGR